MNLVSIIGTRPQYIKLASLLSSIKESNINHYIIDTGQHYDSDMTDIFYTQFGIEKPQYNLGVGSMNQIEQIANISKGLGKILSKKDLDGVIVYGDTNSTLSAALTASKLSIPIFHIESGLRSFNRSMPEEINRIVTDHLSTLLFCPSDKSVKNLKNEGIVSNVFCVGDVMYDVYLRLRDRFISSFEHDYSLLTIHRQENTSVDNFIKRIAQVSDLNEDIIFPAHPRTKKLIEQNRISIPGKIKIVEPMGWLELMGAIDRARYIITDSGGMQKEALWSEKLCVTLRDETEWTETIDGNINILVGLEDSIDLSRLDSGGFKNISGVYGSGDAASKIINKIVSYLG